MGFLSPWFLAGFAALGLPVFLHLLRRHRSVPLRFSSLMLFERRQQSSVKHRRLRYLLLLAFRLALLLLLVLAFANPFIDRMVQPGEGGQRLMVIAIDDSFSMRQGGRLDRAKQEALSLLAGTPAAGRKQVLAFGSQVKLLSQPGTDPQALRAAIEAIEPTDSRSSYGELARALRSLAESSRMPLEVHLFSDMQKTSMPPGFADLRLAGDTRLILHKMSEQRAPNWAVESVTAPHRLYDTKKSRVRVTVAGFGTGKASRTVTLRLNDRVLATKTIETPANGRASVEFTALDVPYGLNRGEVRIEPADAFADDDRYLFSMERSDPRKVLFVHDARRSRGLLYFRTALESSQEVAFSLEEATTDRLPDLSPAKYAFVVLSDAGQLPGAFEQSLQNYVKEGGGVFIALGPVSAVRARVPVLNEAIGESRYSSRSGDRFQMAGDADATHPSLRGTNRWAGVRFYQAVRVDPKDSRVAARLGDGTPILLDRKIGEGRVVVFASTFDNISNDFPLHTSFVPFVEQTAHYLSGQDERQTNFTVDANMALHSARDRRAAVEVLDPEGKRAMSLQEAASAESFKLTRSGFYEVRRGNARNELIAVNPDRRESDLEPIGEETLALWQNTGDSPQAAEGGAEAERKPFSLWWYLVLALLAVSAAESILASRYLGESGESPADDGVGTSDEQRVPETTASVR